MRFDGASIANGVPGGVCHREIDLLGAILRDAYGRMRSQGNVAEAFPRTAPAAGGVQSIAAIILGRGIAQLFLRQNGLAGEDYGAEFVGHCRRIWGRRTAGLVSQRARIAPPHHSPEPRGSVWPGGPSY